ncbi:PREDICTED: homeobox protein XHOX-7.1' [Wasmannia auropunctata]|uniref:homeobox protein XHOX-7.1' n=1 Tax=Wasmannia auropunctata TaxID=64793 RepID=UPI0005F02115|nr:PREDICTED: homeobox protein XHOX-7.1' [Wasmannia auropunctata]
MRLAKKKKERRKRGTCPTGPGRVRSTTTRSRVPRIRVCMYIYIAKGSSFEGFSEAPGMTSEARGSRTGNTDFSIARILAGELPGDDVDARKRRESSERCSDSPRRETRATRERTSGRACESEVRDRAPGETCHDAPVVAERRRSGDRDGESATRWTDLTWLQYTRYRPPRLPRRSLAERRVKRRVGDHPRIPFSSSQLQVLEDRYKRGAYLSRSDVIEMSATLRLPQSKIKIWFQNRRARQRRESLNSTITAR